MGHTPEGTLRRLVDEPFAVADTDAAHVASCTRCSDRFAQVRDDASGAASFLVRPQPVPDLDDAWRRLQASGAPSGPGAEARPEATGPKRRSGPLGGRRAVAAAAALVAVAGAAAGVTAALSPNRSAPAAGSAADVRELADVIGLGNGPGVLGGFEQSAGALRLPFGLLTWRSDGPPRHVGSIAAAERATGLRLRSPDPLPQGVSAASQIVVEPAVVARLRFDRHAGPGVAGTTLTVTAGPAVVVTYGGRGPLGIPTLASFAMRRPVVTATSSSAAPLEAFVLSQPSLPSGLGQEIRLLGDLPAVLPVTMPRGAQVSQVDVDGAPGVLVSADGVASGVIWEDHAGVVRAVVGLLEPRDVLGVADQLG